jgi:hypothetical protein
LHIEIIRTAIIKIFAVLFLISFSVFVQGKDPKVFNLTGTRIISPIEEKIVKEAFDNTVV